MIIEFKTSNFGVFKEEAVLSLVPDLEDEPERARIAVLKKGEHRANAMAAMYGYTGAGKTTLIKALDVFRRILGNRGSIRDNFGTNSPFLTSQQFSYIPNWELQDQPTGFGIEVVVDLIKIEYAFSIEGLTADEQTRRIASESLTIGGVLIFERQGSLVEVNPEVGGLWSKLLTTQELGVKEPMCCHELFLTNITTLEVSDRYAVIAKSFLNWVDKSLIIIPNEDSLRQAANRVFEKEQLDMCFGRVFETLMKLGARKMTLKRTPRFKYEVVSEVSPNRWIETSQVESRGITHLVYLLPVLMEALINGRTLVIDDFDSNLHTFKAQNIFKMFHDPEVNAKTAQLIVGVNNADYMTNALLRKEEIVFVSRIDPERQPDKSGSEVYALSDFEIANPDGYAEYTENYYQGAYGSFVGDEASNLFEMWRAVGFKENNEEKDRLRV